MARRRLAVGRTLLAASSGMVMVYSGCSAAVSGNLVAPPLVELCITAEPETAEVKLDVATLDEAGCAPVYQASVVSIVATAEGYEDYEESLSVEADMTHAIALTPVDSGG